MIGTLNYRNMQIRDENWHPLVVSLLTSVVWLKLNKLSQLYKFSVVGILINDKYREFLPIPRVYRIQYFSEEFPTSYHRRSSDNKGK